MSVLVTGPYIVTHGYSMPLGEYWKWDVGDQVTIPRDSGGHTRGMIMGHVPDSSGDPYGSRYIVKDDDSPNAVYYQKKFLERYAFVSQLSFKEQAMEEIT